MKMDYHAFVNKDLNVKPTSSGRLDGLTFAVKDIFDIKNHTCTAGNPDWLRTHDPAEEYAPAVARLLNKGAKLVGTTITDELMYSLNGENYHYGTPVNPKDSKRIPGGSSSGSAVAVSAEIVDFALGTDTGGSVRIPAAYCGIYGYRPTHGLIPLEGVVPLAQSFDTVGVLSRETNVLLKVASTLIEKELNETGLKFKRIIIGEDTFSLADKESNEALSPFVSWIESFGNQIFHYKIAKEGLLTWSTAFRTLQGIEIWKNHGEWIKKVKPTFGPDINDRFQWASTLKELDSKPYKELRGDIQKRMTELLADDGLLVIPTVPGVAPLCQQSGDAIEKRRSQTMQLSGIAGMAGLPQITIPVTEINGVPIGLSIIAGPHEDLRLLQWVNKHLKQRIN
ncbi:amidase [Evansella sp. AB-P1]|uniref:amidase n=1 Tax=Evansella sp. AB-P1 TaxID=3037653 RepID=UPI00241F6FE1|nr:amidase [Evansella sp. AB-P1]MDG5787901.1 amidase [Evansella sp. AB-P1]